MEKAAKGQDSSSIEGDQPVGVEVEEAKGRDSSSIEGGHPRACTQRTSVAPLAPRVTPQGWTLPLPMVSRPLPRKQRCCRAQPRRAGKAQGHSTVFWT